MGRLIASGFWLTLSIVAWTYETDLVVLWGSLVISHIWMASYKWGGR
jgi:hypothetical protein